MISNMNEWTYDGYLDMIDMAMANDNDLYLRHDVDISIDKALQMAELESTRQYHSTYFILLSSPFYNALEAHNLEKIRMIRSLGMGIGLHYDLSINEQSLDMHVKEIIVQLGLMINHVGPIDAVTFHKPMLGQAPTTKLFQELFKEGVFSPTHADHHYISDSGHNWRENFVETIQENKKIHMNTHPEWYNDEAQSYEECLDGLKLDKSADKLIQVEKRSIREYQKRLV